MEKNLLRNQRNSAGQKNKSERMVVPREKSEGEFEGGTGLYKLRDELTIQQKGQGESNRPTNDF